MTAITVCESECVGEHAVYAAGMCTIYLFHRISDVFLTIWYIPYSICLLILKYCYHRILTLLLFSSHFKSLLPLHMTNLQRKWTRTMQNVESNSVYTQHLPISREPLEVYPLIVSDDNLSLLYAHFIRGFITKDNYNIWNCRYPISIYCSKKIKFILTVKF